MCGLFEHKDLGNILFLETDNGTKSPQYLRARAKLIYFSTLLKQNWYQQQVIKQSVERICELEAKLICLEPVPKRKKRRWFGLFSSN